MTWNGGVAIALPEIATAVTVVRYVVTIHNVIAGPVTVSATTMIGRALLLSPCLSSRLLTVILNGDAVIASLETMALVHVARYATTLLAATAGQVIASVTTVMSPTFLPWQWSKLLHPSLDLYLLHMSTSLLTHENLRLWSNFFICQALQL